MESNISTMPFCDTTLSSRQKRPHLLRDARPRHFAQERIATFDTGHGCLRAVLGSGTVYEFAGEVHDELSLMIHSHPAVSVTSATCVTSTFSSAQ